MPIARECAPERPPTASPVPSRTKIPRRARVAAGRSLPCERSSTLSARKRSVREFEEIVTEPEEQQAALDAVLAQLEGDCE